MQTSLAQAQQPQAMRVVSGAFEGHDGRLHLRRIPTWVARLRGHRKTLPGDVQRTG